MAEPKRFTADEWKRIEDKVRPVIVEWADLETDLAYQLLHDVGIKRIDEVRHRLDKVKPR